MTEPSNGRESPAPIPSSEAGAPLSLEEQFFERCKKADIPYTRFEQKTQMDLLDMLVVSYEVQLRSGREKRVVRIPPGTLQEFLASDFDQLVFLGDYQAVCNYNDSYVEALLTRAGIRVPLGRMFYSRILGQEENEEGKDQYSGLRLKSPSTSPQEIDVEISPATKQFTLLLAGSDPFVRRMSKEGERPTTIKLRGARLANHDEALKALEKYANALFFEIDLLFHYPISLARRLGPRRFFLKEGSAADICFPTHEYDPEPLSLYWYARSASEMPLLQYLAYYQVIEYYFPVYADLDAQRRIRGILRDPTFRIEVDSHISRILSAIKGQGRAYGSETDQLRATLYECVDRQALTDFVEQDEDRKEFFTTTSKDLPCARLALSDKSADIRSLVTSRVYELRCMIVHTKSDAADSGNRLLLPYSKGADLLQYDVELIEFLAQRVLIAASSRILV